jgi:hypothetical protein
MKKQCPLGRILCDTQKNLSFIGSDGIRRGALAALLLPLLALSLASCNVTRTVTTQSQYYQRGDTSVVIQTKTVESYDASKKLY